MKRLLSKIKFSMMLIFTGSLITSCGTIGSIDKNTNLLGDEETIFVIGVSSKDYEIVVFPGRVVDSKFDLSALGVGELIAAPEHGFVVGKADSGKTLAIHRFILKAKPGSWIEPWFEPCGDQETMVFTLPTGKVVYVGDVNIKGINSSRQLQYEFGQSFEKAKNYINQYYPNLRGRLEKIPYKIIPITHICPIG